MSAFFWFRQDFRLTDNPAIQWAVQGARQIPGCPLGQVIIRWLLVALLAAGTARAFAVEPVLPTGEVIIARSDGVAVRFAAEFALTKTARRRGLMWRETIDPYQGMLFDFEVEQYIQMWMKNTLMPLDMIFIASDGKVVAIMAHTKPRALDTIDPGVPARYVFEINAGMSRELDLRRGDRMWIRRPVP